MKNWYLFLVLMGQALLLGNVVANESNESEIEPKTGITPDLRDDGTRLKLQKGDIVVVPIPISNPTLDSGLVVGGAYFYAQTAAQKKTQPASVTAAAAMYTSTDSYAYGIAQQNYWKNDKWRFAGVFGRADLKLALRAPSDAADEESLDWLINGNFLYTQLLRNIAGRWYAGLVTRFVDVNQSFVSSSSPGEPEDIPETKAVGLGINLEYDHRDMPLNSYSGNVFQLKSLFNDESFGSDSTYQSYDISYRSYHETKVPLVLAWEVEACSREGDVPLWDLCRIPLRGFSATDYLARNSVSAQFEARWRAYKNWGVVAFVGGGYLVSTYIESDNRDVIPSYGIGLRYMVLKAKRINIRIDYARSKDSDAIYLSVGEAF
jgi:dihydrofolate reductase